MRKALIVTTLLGSFLSLAVALPYSLSDCSSDSKVAARYYLRNRTSNFYRRAQRPRKQTVALQPVVVDDLAPAQESQYPTVEEGAPQLAARYYLRNRSRSFYRRAHPKSRRIFG